MHRCRCDVLVNERPKMATLLLPRGVIRHSFYMRSNLTFHLAHKRLEVSAEMMRCVPSEICTLVIFFMQLREIRTNHSFILWCFSEETMRQFYVYVHVHMATGRHYYLTECFRLVTIWPCYFYLIYMYL